MKTIPFPATVTSHSGYAQAGEHQSMPGRLVVVVPDVAEPGLLAGRIQEVALTRGRDVLLMGAASQQVSEDELRRKLALLAAFLRNAGTQTEIRIEKALDVIAALRPLLTEDDLLACCVGDSLPVAGDRWIELLGKRLQRPVHAFMNYGPREHRHPNLVARAAPWLGSIVVIAGFTWLQIALSQNGEGAAETLGLLASVPVEVGLVLLCNALLG